MKNYSILIGENPTDKTLDKKKVVEIVGKYFSTFISYYVQVYHLDKASKQLRIEITSDDEYLVEQCAICLKHHMELEYIGLQVKSITNRII